MPPLHNAAVFVLSVTWVEITSSSLVAGRSQMVLMYAGTMYSQCGDVLAQFSAHCSVVSERPSAEHVSTVFIVEPHATELGSHTLHLAAVALQPWAQLCT